MDKPLLTIFTPTYNRGYCLHRCYKSLLRQLNKNFIWMVVDDGSTDDTKELVKSWQEENDEFKIEYIYQENLGAHAAHNTAYENISTVLNVCIDSDDYMPDNAVDNILSAWNSNTDEDVAGIIALMTYSDGTIIENNLPRDRKTTTLFEYKHTLKNDSTKKMIYRTDLIKKNPYPEIRDEKYYPLNYKYYLLDLEYKLIVLHEPVCRVEYMADSMERGLLHENFKNPKGFLHWYLFLLNYPLSDTSFKMKKSVKYVCACLIAKDKNWLRKSPCKIVTLIASPLGWFRYIKLLLQTGRYMSDLFDKNNTAGKGKRRKKIIILKKK